MSLNIRLMLAFLLALAMCAIIPLLARDWPELSVIIAAFTLLELALFSNLRRIRKTASELAQAAHAGNNNIHPSGIDELDAAAQTVADRCNQLRLATKSTLDALPHAVAILSNDAKIQLANHLADSLFHLSSQSAALPNWLLPLVAEVQQSLAAGHPKGCTPNQPVQVFDNHRELFFLPAVSPILSPDQKLAGILVLLQNATELRQVEEAKSGLLASVSHELKTPLTSIQMAIHLLSEDQTARFSDRQRELLQTAAQDANRLQEIIQHLLDKART